MSDPMKLLSDPRACGEDLVAIANRAMELAPALCTTCQSYHMRVPAVRAAGVGISIEADRSWLIDTIAGLFTSGPLKLKPEPVIAIMGSADTGLLATAAHALAVASPERLQKTTFIVADLCRTPLALCGEFADRYGLTFVPMQADFVHGQMQFRADLVILHSVLRFVAAEERSALLRKLKECLTPEGRIVLSNHVFNPAENALPDLSPSKTSVLQHVFALFENGTLHAPMPLETLKEAFTQSLLVSQNRDSVIATLADAEQLFTAAGVLVESAEILRFQSKGAVGARFRDRLVAVVR